MTFLKTSWDPLLGVISPPLENMCKKWEDFVNSCLLSERGKQARARVRDGTVHSNPVSSFPLLNLQSDKIIIFLAVKLYWREETQ